MKPKHELVRQKKIENAVVKALQAENCVLKRSNQILIKTLQMIVNEGEHPFVAMEKAGKEVDNA